MGSARERKRRLGSFWLLLVLTWFAAQTTRADEPGPAAAQPVETPPTPELSTSSPNQELERARVLFKQGVELARSRDFGNAAARFREALALRSAPAVQYNLAAALSQLGQHAEAFNLCQLVIHSAEAPADVQAHCQKLMEEVTPRTARLTVLASAGGDVPEIAIDGVPLPADQLGFARALPAGLHRVTAERNHERFFEREVSIPLGTAALVNVSLIVTESVVVQKQLIEVARPDQRRDQAAEDPALRKRRRWLWSAITAGVVVVGAGVAVALVLTKPERSTQAPVSGSLNPGVLTWK